MDTGPGSLANLQQHIDLTSLDAIVVSHSHPDHWGELGVVRNALKYGFQIEGMPLYSTTAVRKLVDIVCGDSSEPTFRWGIVANGDTVTIGDLDFSFSETDHPVETLAMRIASQRQVAALLRRHGAGLVARGTRPRRGPCGLRGDAARGDRGERAAPLVSPSRAVRRRGRGGRSSSSRTSGRRLTRVGTRTKRRKRSVARWVSPCRARPSW